LQHRNEASSVNWVSGITGWTMEIERHLQIVAHFTYIRVELIVLEAPGPWWVP